MKKHFSTVLLLLIFLIGLSLLLYPTVSNYWNSLHQSRAISNYSDTVAKTDSATYEKLLQTAAEYNAMLREKPNVFRISEEERNEYYSMLDITGTGMIGYVEIPAIDVSLPIYHGTSEPVLQVAAGHLEWSSLPIGGEGTHAVLSGHRGLPSAKLFTNLDKLSEGDLFMMQILNETLTYEIDRILIVDPDDTSALTITAGADYCTLVTCTPYGINTHRLLVRGHRVENQPEARQVRVTADAIRIEPLLVTPMIALPILLALLIPLMVKTDKRRLQKSANYN